MLLSNIKASPNRIPLSNINTTSFTINYNKWVDQIKVLAKRRDTFSRTLTTTKEPCLLHLASYASIMLQ